jgi:hypothetical protein
MSLNPKIRQDANGAWWLDWTSDPQAVAYDIITSGGIHIQAGKAATTVKLTGNGAPKPNPLPQIASAHAGVYETATDPTTPPPTPSGHEGRVTFCPFMSSAYTPYLDNASATQKQWMAAHWQRYISYTPYMDSKLSWLPNGWVYKDAYDGRFVIAAHPDWILKDHAGNNLYIPYGNLPYAQPAADFGHQPYRDFWISQAKAAVAKGYKGLHVDDVNMDINVAYVNGGKTTPWDPRTGAMMTPADWRRDFAEFLEQIRAALPKPIEISHNALWWVGNDGADPFVQRQIKACDVYSLERGFNDRNPAFTPPVFVRQMNFIDRLHALGISANNMSDEGGLTPQMGFFNIACALLCSNGHDYLYGYGWQPDHWFAPNDTDLGSAPKPRYQVSSNVWARDFTDAQGNNHKVTADLAARVGTIS